MSEQNIIDEILDFAIGEEEKAAKFYTFMADRVEKPWIRKLFKEFADEEKSHKEKLLGFRKGETLKPADKQVQDLKISDYTVEIEPSADINYQDALILAMKKEKAAFRLYSDLAAAAADNSVRDLFLALAQEEAKHKLRFEVEYDDKVYAEN